jgi:voltage-gated potassium channel
MPPPWRASGLRSTGFAADHAPAVAASSPLPSPRSSRERWRRIIFEADTPAGRAFDVLLIIAILLSVLAVMLASVPHWNVRWHGMFVGI